jgi:hypothetical protein
MAAGARGPNGERLPDVCYQRSDQGARPYFAILAYQTDGRRVGRAKYTPFRDRAGALYQAMLGDLASEAAEAR